MNRVAVRSRRIVTNWIVPFLAQDGRAYRFAGEERSEVSGRCDDLHYLHWATESKVRYPMC